MRKRRSHLNEFHQCLKATGPNFPATGPKQKLRTFITTRPDLPEMLREVFKKKCKDAVHKRKTCESVYSLGKSVIIPWSSEKKEGNWLKKKATCISPSKLGKEDKLLSLQIRNTRFQITPLGYRFWWTVISELNISHPHKVLTCRGCYCPRRPASALFRRSEFSLHLRVCSDWTPTLKV